MDTALKKQYSIICEDSSTLEMNRFAKGKNSTEHTKSAISVIYKNTLTLYKIYHNTAEDKQRLCKPTNGEHVQRRGEHAKRVLFIQ